MLPRRHYCDPRFDDISVILYQYAAAVPPEDMEEWHRTTLVKLSQASSALRRSDVCPATEIYEAILKDFDETKTPSSDRLNFFVEAKLGLAEVHFIYQRQEHGAIKICHLLRSLGIAQMLSDLLSSYTHAQSLSVIQFRLLQDSVRSKRTTYESCFSLFLNSEMCGSGRPAHYTSKTQRAASFYHKFDLSADRFCNTSPKHSRQVKSAESSNKPIEKFVEDFLKVLMHEKNDNWFENKNGNTEPEEIISLQTKEEYQNELNEFLTKTDNLSLKQDLNDLVKEFVQNNFESTKSRVMSTNMSGNYDNASRKEFMQQMKNFLKISECLKSDKIKEEIEYDANYLVYTLKKEQTKKIQNELQKRRMVIADTLSRRSIGNRCYDKSYSNTFPFTKNEKRNFWPEETYEDFESEKNGLSFNHKMDPNQSRLLNCDKSEILSTLLRSLLDVAKGHMDQGMLETAEDLFRSGIVLCKTLSKEFDKTDVERFEIPKTYFYLGKIYYQLGQEDASIKFLDKSIQLFEKCEDQERGDKALVLADAWFLLGSVYLGNQSNETSFFRCVLSLLYQSVAQDVFQTHDLNKLFPQQESTQKAQEAKKGLNAFQKCHEVINKIITLTDEEADSVTDSATPPCQVQVLMKIGDCFLTLNDYDMALEYYEKALILHNSGASSGAGTSDQVHILCMLGTVRLLTDNPSQSVAIFETARILMRHRNANESCLVTGLDYNLLGLWAPLSVSYFKVNEYIKCISACDNVVNHFLAIYEEEQHKASKPELWLLKQCYFMMGTCHLQLRNYEYSTINLEKAKNISGTDMHQMFLVWASLLQLLQNVFENDEEQLIRNVTFLYAEILCIESDLSEMDTMNYAACCLLSELCTSAVKFFKAHNNTTMSNRFTKLSLKCQMKKQASPLSSIVALTINVANNALSCLELERAQEVLKGGIETCCEELGFPKQEYFPLINKLAEVSLAKFNTERRDILFESRMVQQIGDETNSYFNEALDIKFQSDTAVKYAIYLLQMGQKSESKKFLEKALESLPSSEQKQIEFYKFESVVLPSLLSLEFESSQAEKLEFSLELFATYLLLGTTTSKSEIISYLTKLFVLSVDSKNPHDLYLSGVAFLLYGFFWESALLFSLSEKTCHCSTVLRSWSLAYSTHYCHYLFALTTCLILAALICAYKQEIENTRL